LTDMYRSPAFRGRHRLVSDTEAIQTMITGSR
jgi:hypothetical protein